MTWDIAEGNVKPRPEWDLQFVVEPDGLDGGFVAECPHIPGAIARGETQQEAFINLSAVLDEMIVALQAKRDGH